MITASIDNVSPLQYARAVHCTDVSNMPQVDLEAFLRTSKEDWNIRAAVDASLYVCASPGASEADLRATGEEDVLREFVPRIVGYPHDTILELGCGFGRMSIFIADYSTRFYGVDISGALVQQAFERLVKYRSDFGPDGQARYGTFMEVDGQTVQPIEDGVVDVAFTYIMFQHIPVEDVIVSYIRDVHRVLKPGGVFIMNGRDVPRHWNSSAWATLGNSWHGCQCGPELVRRAIDGLSFTVVREEGVGTARYWATLQKGA